MKRSQKVSLHDKKTGPEHAAKATRTEHATGTSGQSPGVNLS